MRLKSDLRLPYLLARLAQLFITIAYLSVKQVTVCSRDGAYRAYCDCDRRAANWLFDAADGSSGLVHYIPEIVGCLDSIHACGDDS